MNVRRKLNAFGIAAVLFLMQIDHYAFSQSPPDALRGVTHSATLTFVKRDGTCVYGPISKVDSSAITIQPYKKPPITIDRSDLLQVVQGDALLFSASSSWADVQAAHVVPHEAFVLKTRSGKVIKGKPLKVTADSIALKHGLITTEYSKAEIISVDYLRVRPESDGWDYFAQESPELLFVFPETYYRLMGLEGTVPVRLYDASIPESHAAPRCPRG
jgi:hypothetical protein